jgi:hypothetical protein
MPTVGLLLGHGDITRLLAHKAHCNWNWIATMLVPYLTDASKLGLALLVGSVAAQSFPVTFIVPSADDIALAASQEHFFSYGRSPGVGPSPQTSGDGRWENAYRQARELVDEMTNDEKNNLTYGYVGSPGCDRVTIDVST